jgi:hypothetical protein
MAIETTRPLPPVDILSDASDRFEPSNDLAAWVRHTFIESEAPLHNPEHAHLDQAVLGFLWTNVANARKGRSIVGQAEPGTPQGAMGKWARARALMQVEEWFGDVPDFIITLDAAYAAACDDASFCALVEHELYHCAQDQNEFGAPKFTRDGRPAFTMRGHDVEEFVGVVRRYGIAATGIEEMVRAANRGPEIAAASVAHVCGTCLARRAA